jgi:hypothetical protein
MDKTLDELKNEQLFHHEEKTLIYIISTYLA